MQPPLPAEPFAGERIVQLPCFQNEANGLIRHLLDKFQDLRQRSVRQYRQRVVIHLGHGLIQRKARFPLANHFHHPGMPARDGHHCREFPGINAGAGIEDLIAGLLQFYLHLPCLKQGFGADQCISCGIFQHLQSGVRITANCAQRRRNR